MSNKKYCLGIESTAHTFGISILNFNGKILSNIKKSYSTKKGGMIPSKVADHHVEIFDIVLVDALKKSKINLNQINLIAFSNAPGLGNTLKIGQFISKYLSLKYNIPLIGVNHCIAHLEIGRLLTKAKDPILLYTSGANTQIIAYEANKYRIFGETLDIGVGNFLDALARELELGFPGGPKIEQLAIKGKKFIPLPYVVKGMDVSFGGLLTHIKQIIKTKNKKELTSQFKYDLCYSVQETIFSMLLEVSERALSHCNKNELLLGGGVACNKRLQKMSDLMCKNRNAKLFLLDNEFNVDNAAMIAWLGVLKYNNLKNKHKYINNNEINFEINPYERTDEIEIFWRK
ncbi:MAG: KEOPS complex N(6)-L-threonylcarbamoyladenine synthase Kae1 [Candidatus Woesearchaeota archaeon]